YQNALVPCETKDINYTKDGGEQSCPHRQFQQEYVCGVTQRLGWVLRYVTDNLLIEAKFDRKANKRDKADREKQLAESLVAKKAAICRGQRESRYPGNYLTEE